MVISGFVLIFISIDITQVDSPTDFHLCQFLFSRNLNFRPIKARKSILSCPLTTNYTQKFQALSVFVKNLIQKSNFRLLTQRVLEKMSELDDSGPFKDARGVGRRRLGDEENSFVHSCGLFQYFVHKVINLFYLFLPAIHTIGHWQKKRFTQVCFVAIMAW